MSEQIQTRFFHTDEDGHGLYIDQFDNLYDEAGKCIGKKADRSLKVDDSINHPEHYGGDTTYETIKVIEAWNLGFHLGNCVKYVSRAGHKGDALEDLKKAKWYLDRAISQLEEIRSVSTPR